MFKLQPNPTFEAVVSIPVPGGGEDKIKFKFKRLGKKVLRDLFGNLSGTQETEVDEVAILKQIIDGWSGVDAEFSDEALAQLCENYPAATGVIVNNYSTKMFGAVEKN